MTQYFLCWQCLPWRARKCKLSALVSSLPARYTFSDRLQNFPSEQSAKLLTLLAQDTQQANLIMAPEAGMVVSIDTKDGLRISFSHGDIVHLRPSGNAPELRCYAEAESQEKAKILCNQCLQRIKAINIL